MVRLRTPFLIVAIVLILLVVLIEVGTTLPGVLRGGSVPVTALPDHPPFTSEQQKALDQLSNQDHPPGQGIPDLALIDGIVLFTIALVGIALVVPERLQGRVQGIATLVFS